MAKLLGFSGVLDNIADEASTVISKSNNIAELMKGCKDDSKLETYNKDIQSWKDKFVGNSDIIKKAKQDKDVDTLSQALKDMLQLIKDYNSYLDKILDELK